MWIFAIVLLVLIASTLAMGVWFISVPLALLLISLPLLGGFVRRFTETRQVERFRDRSEVNRHDPEGGRDHGTLYEPDSQGQPTPADSGE